MIYKNRKSESLAINKLIILILIVLAIVLVAFYLYREDIWNYIKNLPGYTVSQNDTEVDYSQMKPDELAKYECIKVGNIVYISGFPSKDYIFIGNTATKLYVRIWPKETLIVFHTGNFGDEIAVGTIENGIIKINSEFLDRGSQYYLQYANFLPSVGDLKMINGAFILGVRTLCKKEGQILELKQESECLDSCEIHNGLCKESGADGEIGLGKINCKDNKQCFVKKVEEKKENSQMILSTFSIFDIEKTSSGSSFSEQKFLEFQIGERRLVGFTVLYPKNKDEGKQKGFCYEIRSNDRIFEMGYNKNEINGVLISSSMTLEGNERIFEVVAWDSSSDPAQKVLKRFEINPKLASDFNGLTFLSNEKFREEILKNLKGNFYVVDVPFKFENGLITSTYRIDKYSDKIEVYGYYRLKGEEKNNWYALDCYTGFMGFISIGINLDKIQSSLMETLIKNKCKLKYY